MLLITLVMSATFVTKHSSFAYRKQNKKIFIQGTKDIRSRIDRR